MKSINLEEETKFYKEENIDWMMQDGTRATKRDILQACIPILEELSKEQRPFHGIMLTRSGMRVGNFIEWLDRLVNEKGDTI